MNKKVRNFEHAMRGLVHNSQIVSIIGTANRQELKVLAKAAKLRARVIALGAEKQAKAILKAGTMGAPLCKFCDKNNVSMDMMQSEKVIAKAADKLSRRAPKSPRVVSA